MAVAKGCQWPTQMGSVLPAPFVLDMLTVGRNHLDYLGQVIVVQRGGAAQEEGDLPGNFRWQIVKVAGGADHREPHLQRGA
jgi:hypothetical protein